MAQESHFQRYALARVGIGAPLHRRGHLLVPPSVEAGLRF